ncbi:hypothetical protein GALMADRAFT_208985 [Galerina marginata CBS 339.88]|uniref:MYND-type domain-containing protein n=1 Tax=Galerina marginata (strain CBS 339.88) TaxID=685588 RepID=A0A067TIH6_GALM3|nr:hypothetical protein GALMADRAFT_208985 [Galerina marginata CBS 339.88]
MLLDRDPHLPVYQRAVYSLLMSQIPPTSGHKCSVCNRFPKEKKDYPTCARCQKQDWPSHKQWCSEPDKPRNFILKWFRRIGPDREFMLYLKMSIVEDFIEDFTQSSSAHRKLWVFAVNFFLCPIKEEHLTALASPNIPPETLSRVPMVGRLMASKFVNISDQEKYPLQPRIREMWQALRDDVDSSRNLVDSTSVVVIFKYLGDETYAVVDSILPEEIAEVKQKRELARNARREFPNPVRHLDRWLQELGNRKGDKLVCEMGAIDKAFFRIGDLAAQPFPIVPGEHVLSRVGDMAEGFKMIVCTQKCVEGRLCECNASNKEGKKGELSTRCQLLRANSKSRNLPRLRPLTRGKSYLVVSPNPMDHPRSLVPCWGLQLGDTEGSVEEEWATWNPSFAVAYNDGPTDGGKQLDKGILEMMHKRGDKLRKYGRNESDPWFRFWNRGKNRAQEQRLREMFLELLDDFPDYQLRTQQGLEQSAEDMSAVLRVATKYLEADSILTQYDKTLLDHESIDWVELSKNAFDSKLTPSQLKNYWVDNAWPKYEALRHFEEPYFVCKGDEIRSENSEYTKERPFTYDDLERVKTSQEYKYILYA